MLRRRVREVEEETGFGPTISPDLGTVEYIAARRPAKTVRWYSMARWPRSAQPAHDVDEVAGSTPGGRRGSA